MTYDEAMERFGHDAPDLRFGMEIVDCTDLAAECEFRVFQSAAERGDFVRGMCAPQAAAQFSRKRIDELTDYVKQDFGAKGLVWFRVTRPGSWSRPRPRTSRRRCWRRSPSGWRPSRATCCCSWPTRGK